MRECLDDAILQSYFDGELSTEMMEKATSHLASCVTCAAAARELEQETALLMEALAPEFEAAVPTERLRRNIDAAVAGLHVVRPVVSQQSGLSGFFNSLSSFLTLSPQRTFGYASLVLLLMFAAIFGLVKFKSQSSSIAVNTPKVTTQAPSIDQSSTSSQASNNKEAVAQNDQPKSDIPAVKVSSPEEVATPTTRPAKAKTLAAPKPAPVRLLPGERSYLQTIAKLDTAIKSEKRAMRPALQVEYERNLAVVDRAIAATRSAAKSNPSDPDAAEFMFAAYQSKVDLLNTIADARMGERSH